MIKPAKYDFLIYKGATFEESFIYKNKTTGAIIPLTGYSGSVEFRATQDNPTVLLSLTVLNGGFIIDAPAGKFTFKGSPVQSAAFTLKSLYFVLHLTDPASDTWRVMQGTATIVS